MKRLFVTLVLALFFLKSFSSFSIWEQRFRNQSVPKNLHNMLNVFSIDQLEKLINQIQAIVLKKKDEATRRKHLDEEMRRRVLMKVYVDVRSRGSSVLRDFFASRI